MKGVEKGVVRNGEIKVTKLINKINRRPQPKALAEGYADRNPIYGGADNKMTTEDNKYMRVMGHIWQSNPCLLHRQDLRNQCQHH